MILLIKNEGRIKAERRKSKFYVTPAKSLAATAVMEGVEKTKNKNAWISMTNISR